MTTTPISTPMANALSYAALALGLNVVVGMAGLLDLGYAAFFAIGAYTYGVLSSFQLQPEWTSFWEPFAWLGLVARMPGPGRFRRRSHHVVVLAGPAACRGGRCGVCGIVFGAPTLRLRGDYLAIVTLGFGEIVPDHRAQLGQRDEWRIRAERSGPPPASMGTSFGVDATPYYYVIVALVAVLIFVSIRLA